METRGRKRLAQEAEAAFALKKSKFEGTQQILKSPIEALPVELLLMIFSRLKVQSLKNLCCVSHRYQDLAQPLIFENFDSGLYEQRGLWTRLTLLAEALSNRPALGQNIAGISIRFKKLDFVDQLANLLLPILSAAKNLRSLSLPLHEGIAALLQDPEVGYLKKGLNVREAYNEPVSLNNLELIRHPLLCDQPGIRKGPGDYQLRHLWIGECQLDYRGIINLLQHLPGLKGLVLRGVRLWDSESSTCRLKVEGILGALNSSNQTLTDLFLDVRNTQPVDSDIPETLTFGAQPVDTDIPKTVSFEKLCILETLMVHENDLAEVVVKFPASLIHLTLYDLEVQPKAPFFGNGAYQNLPPSLRTISSYSRKPDILQQKHKELELPGIKVVFKLYDDRLPKGPFRTPDDPSY